MRRGLKPYKLELVELMRKFVEGHIAASNFVADYRFFAEDVEAILLKELASEQSM